MVDVGLGRLNKEGSGCSTTLWLGMTRVDGPGAGAVCEITSSSSSSSESARSEAEVPARLIK